MKIDLLNLPKKEIREIPIEDLIKTVQKMRGENLRSLYIKICSEDGLLHVQNNTEMLQREICHQFQKERHGDISTRHYNILNRAKPDDVREEKQIKKLNKFSLTTGTVLIREWREKKHEVLVVDGGFQYEGVIYKSLSKIAKIIRGCETSGPLFFGLRKNG